MAGKDKGPAAEYSVPDELAGARLDKAVAHLTGQSRKQARLLIATGRVQVNGRQLKVLARQVRGGQRLRVTGGALPTTIAAGRVAETLVEKKTAIEILARLAGLVFINKPSGLLSEGATRAGEAPSLETILSQQLGKSVHVVHRLDAQTSGVMVVALNRTAAAAAGTLFRQRVVRKTYWALCSGQVCNQEINAPLGRVDRRRQGVRADGGKPAATTIRACGYDEAANISLVQANPHTGRTHQIRVHLLSVGHPIVGDGLYGGNRYIERGPSEATLPDGMKMVAVPRLMLHAGRLAGPFGTSLAHAPAADTEVRAPWPADFADLVRGLSLPSA